jgi:hypothetical protein
MVLGSALGAKCGLCYGLAVSRPHPKRSPSLPAHKGRVQSKSLLLGAVFTNKIALASGPRHRDDDRPLVVESDLSGEMAVGDQELDAIMRLLGAALDDVLSDTGGE